MTIRTKTVTVSIDDNSLAVVTDRDGNIMVSAEGLPPYSTHVSSFATNKTMAQHTRAVVAAAVAFWGLS